MGDRIQTADTTHAFIERHRVAHLATADAQGRPHVVPVCYAYDGIHLYVVIDTKPKRVAPSKLKRLRNIKENPRVAIIVDDYREDWGRLAYLLIQGRARVLEKKGECAQALRLLRAKYPQYRRMPLEGRPVIQITPERVVKWQGGSRARGKLGVYDR